MHKLLFAALLAAALVFVAERATSRWNTPPTVLFIAAVAITVYIFNTWWSPIFAGLGAEAMLLFLWWRNTLRRGPTLEATGSSPYNSLTKRPSIIERFGGDQYPGNW